MSSCDLSTTVKRCVKSDSSFCFSAVNEFGRYALQFQYS